MKKLGVVLLVAALTLTLVLGQAVSVSAANKANSGNFVTGGGSVKEGKKAAWTFAGNVGYAEDGSVVGQFQINDHFGKETWHCHGDFSFFAFDGDPIVGPTGPSASHNRATFVGTFTSNRGNTETLVVTIVDVDEPGRNNDIILVEYLAGNTWFAGEPIDTGNFQIHGGESPGDPNNNVVN